MVARDQLQEMFGNKKQKAAVRARERNQVDVTQLENVADIIRDTIVENSVNVPTLEKMVEMQSESRPIPPYNMDATKPEDVYKLSDIISDTELNAVPLNTVLKSTTDDAWLTWLPYR
jgi:DNA-directed RNA polymerase I subunit RPA49